jgi:hypothetical protein
VISCCGLSAEGGLTQGLSRRADGGASSRHDECWTLGLSPGLSNPASQVTGACVWGDGHHQVSRGEEVSVFVTNFPPGAALALTLLDDQGVAR